MAIYSKCSINVIDVVFIIIPPNEESLGKNLKCNFSYFS